jgi:hypothetical protein
MKGKGFIVISILVNIGLIGALVLVKQNSIASAKQQVADFNKNTNEEVAIVKEYKVKNNVLWQFAIDAAASKYSDALQLANALEFPALKDKEPTKPTVEELQIENQKAIKVSWEKASVSIIFDSKGNVKEVQTEDLKKVAQLITKDETTGDYKVEK